MTISMQRNAPSGDKNQENPTQQPGAQVLKMKFASIILFL